MIKKVMIVAALAALAGCAQTSENIEAAYISPMAYSAYDCDQLRMEAARVSHEARVAMGAQDRRAESDNTKVAVATILFWPAAFLVKGDGEGASRVAALKGEMQAIEAANTQKSCGIDFGGAAS
ncbi:hypothetical protein ACMA5I_06785 [Paracoccaceae bacterium GXU_MW_L88]